MIRRDEIKAEQNGVAKGVHILDRNENQPLMVDRAGSWRKGNLGYQCPIHCHAQRGSGGYQMGVIAVSEMQIQVLLLTVEQIRRDMKVDGDGRRSIRLEASLGRTIG